LHDGFIWDDEKHKININKHGVTFDEAVSVFDDDRAIYFDDNIHSIVEYRFIIIGMSKFERILLFYHCYKENDSVIRIISARKATKIESQLYRGE